PTAARSCSARSSPKRVRTPAAPTASRSCRWAHASRSSSSRRWPEPVATTHEVGFHSSGSERLAGAGSGTGRVDAALGAIFLFALAAVGAALVSQHVYDMDPCPWCVLQRLIFVAIAVAALLGLAWRRPAGRRTGAVLALLLALGGIAAALWQHFYAAASSSCNLTLADKIMNATRLPTLLPEVFEPRA